MRTTQTYTINHEQIDNFIGVVYTYIDNVKLETTRGYNSYEVSIETEQGNHQTITEYAKRFN